MRTSIISFTVICVVLTANAGLFAEVINVPDDFETIQAGINAAEDGDTVLVQPGEYTERINFFGRDIVLSSLYLLSHNWESVNETSIVSSDNGSIVTFSNGESEDAELVGFTITSDPNDHFRCNEGSGIYCNNANPTIIACIITNQSATFRGGGIFIDGDCSVTIMDCQFLGNEAGFAGGGVYLGHGSAATITRCYFYENIAWDWEQNPGNAIFLGESSATLNFCTIANSPIERIEESGYSAIMLIGSNLNVLNSIIWTGWDVFITSRPDWREESICTIRYSDIENGREAFGGQQNLELIFEDNIEDDPLFIDINGGNHHLTEDSPCVDAGDPESPEDPDGTRADMGAFYYHQNFPPCEFDLLLPENEALVDCRDTVCFQWEASVDPNPEEEVSYRLVLHETELYEDTTIIETDTCYYDLVFMDIDGNGGCVRLWYEWFVYAISEEDTAESESHFWLIVAGTGSANSDDVVPLTFNLASIYPNPFNSSTSIGYSLPAPDYVTLSVHDIQGRLVTVLCDDTLPSGNYRAILRGDELPSGLYFVRLAGSQEAQTSKIMLIR